MRLNRFIGHFDFTNPLVEIRDPRLVRQITKVLRLAPGSSVILGDGKGKEYTAEIKKIDPSRVYLLVRSENGIHETAAHADLRLYCAILKHAHFEFVVEKATEIGVTEIIPLLTERTVKKKVRLERLIDVAREAAEQSGRRFTPKIHEAEPFADAAEKLPDAHSVLFFDPKGELLTPEFHADSKTTHIFIGPEGGWSDEELGVAEKRNWQIVSLGPAILRAETAAIIASYLAISAIRHE